MIDHRVKRVLPLRTIQRYPVVDPCRNPTQPTQHLERIRRNRVAGKRRWPQICLLHCRLAGGDLVAASRRWRALAPLRRKGRAAGARWRHSCASAPASPRPSPSAAMRTACPTSTPLRRTTCSSPRATSPRRIACGRWTPTAATPTANWPRSWAPRCSSTIRRSAFSRFATPPSASTPTCPPDERARFDDYARGVNLFIAQRQDSLPPEFQLLHYRPQPWTGVDSISVGMMMVETLDTHWYTKLARERIAARLHNPKLEADLYPVGSWRDHPPTGELLDLSQPQPQPPPTSDDDEDDERTQTLRRSRRQISDALRDLLGQRRHATAAHRAPTTGSSPAATPPAASRCSRTICTSRLHRAQHLVHGRPARARLSTPPESRCPACPSSSPATTSMWPGDSPRSMPTCRTSTSKSSTAKATYQVADGNGTRSPSIAK